MNVKKQFLKRQKGFSLVELLVVIAIIAVLSVVAYTSFSGSTDQAKNAKVQNDLDGIQNALEVYKSNEGAYPAELKTGLVQDGFIPKTYLSRIPTDPGKAKHPYLYAKQGPTFQVAGVLRKDGDPKNFETYMVGNGEGLLKTDQVSIGYYLNGEVLALCNAGVVLTEGKIATDSAGMTGSCLPYDPTL